MNKLPPDFHHSYRRYADELTVSPSGTLPPHLTAAANTTATPMVKVHIISGTDEAKRQLAAMLPRLSISIDQNGQFSLKGEKSLVATASYYLSLCEWRIVPATQAQNSFSAPSATTSQTQVIKGVLSMINGSR